MRKKLIIYLRLSNEDGDDKDESNSIVNQRWLIWEYIKRHNLETIYEIVEFSDDGYSGKNLERPGIREVLALVRKRETGMIIVKDFSRMARDYIIMGDFIEKIFPFMDIRFVAINNQYDSNDYQGRLPDMDVSFQNLVNDYYSEEKSVKIKAVFQMKHAHGEYTGPVAPYGYKKSQTLKNHIVPDEEAAGIVYRIHCMRFFDSMFPQEIARTLEAEGIPIPSEYLKQKGSKVYFSTIGIKGWNAINVKRILHNSVFLGVMVSEKTRAMETGSSKKVSNPREMWRIAEKTHEPIVPWRMWLANQKPLQKKKGYVTMQGQDSSHMDGLDVGGDNHLPQGMAEQVIKREKISSIKSGQHILPEELRDSPVKGRVWCANCGHKMMRGLGRKRIYYTCSYRYHNAQGICMRGCFREDHLMELVLAAINQQIMVMADLHKFYDREKQKCEENKKAVQNERKRLENRRLSLKREKLELFERYQNGTIGKEKYLALKRENSDGFEKLELEYTKLEHEYQEAEVEDYKCLALYEDKKGIQQLTKELVEELIDRIILYDKEHVEIRFRYADEIEKLVRYTGQDDGKPGQAVS